MIDEFSWGPIEPGPDDAELTARNYAAQMHHNGRVPKTTKKRTGMTPEAKVLKACTEYLELLGCYVLRTSAGFTEFGDRKMTIGRAGAPDLTCCTPEGRYLSVECKAPGGKISEAQQRQHEFIRRRNGIVCIPHSKDELREHLIAAFGRQTVEDWESLGKARKR